VRFLVRLAAAASLLALLAAVAASCSAPGSSSLDERTEPLDVDEARQLFQTTCRSCHALSDAKAAGVFGPDLDLLQPDAERVREQIAEGGGGMPDDLLDGEDADLVARYVAKVAGTGPDAGAEGGSSRGAAKPSSG